MAKVSECNPQRDYRGELYLKKDVEKGDKNGQCKKGFLSKNYGGSPRKGKVKIQDFNTTSFTLEFWHEVYGTSLVTFVGSIMIDEYLSTHNLG